MKEQLGSGRTHNRVFLPAGSRASIAAKGQHHHPRRRQNNQYILQMYNCNFFDQPMMTEWEKKALKDKTYTNAIIFFNNKMASMERYQENSGN